MTDDDFKKQLNNLIPTIDNQPDVKRLCLIYLEHVKDCKEKGIKPQTTYKVRELIKQRLPGQEWIPNKGTIANWIEENL